MGTYEIDLQPEKRMMCLFLPFISFYHRILIYLYCKVSISNVFACVRKSFEFTSVCMLMNFIAGALIGAAICYRIVWMSIGNTLYRNEKKTHFGIFSMDVCWLGACTLAKITTLVQHSAWKSPYACKRADSTKFVIFFSSLFHSVSCNSVRIVRPYEVKSMCIVGEFIFYMGMETFFSTCLWNSYHLYFIARMKTQCVFFFHPFG